MTIKIQKPLNLGEITDLIELRIKESKDNPDEIYVNFDFGSAYPAGLDSYRGWYDRLCWEYTGVYGCIKASEVLQHLMQADGATFTGWKGGEFTMQRHTSVYIACSGCTSDTRVTGVSLQWDNFMVIETANYEDDC